MQRMNRAALSGQLDHVRHLFVAASACLSMMACQVEIGATTSDDVLLAQAAAVDDEVPPVEDESAPVDDGSSALVKGVTASGNGCPAGTWSYGTRFVDGKASIQVHLEFTAYGDDVTTDAGNVTKSCAIVVNFDNSVRLTHMGSLISGSSTNNQFIRTTRTISFAERRTAATEDILSGAIGGPIYTNVRPWPEAGCGGNSELHTALTAEPNAASARKGSYTIASYTMELTVNPCSR